MNHSNAIGGMIVDWPNSRQRIQQSSPRFPLLAQGKQTDATAPSSTSPSKRKGNISFSPTIRIDFVLSLREYTDEEWTATWHTDEEYAKIKKGVRNTVKAMRKASARGINLESIIPYVEVHCTRGLEHFVSSTELERRALTKDQVVSAVLNEQNRQRQVGTCNVHTVAAASSVCSKWTRDAALHEAASDEAQAKAQQESSGIPASPTNVEKQGSGRESDILTMATTTYDVNHRLSKLEQTTKYMYTALERGSKKGGTRGGTPKETFSAISGVGIQMPLPQTF